MPASAGASLAMANRSTSTRPRPGSSARDRSSTTITRRGIDWIVAPLGTALAEGQGALLRRTTQNAYLLYDADAAGLKASFRAADELLRHGMAVQIVTLPSGEDPDTFVRTHGGERLMEQVGHAIDVFERKIQLLERGGWFADLRRKRRALDRLMPTIRATADPITRDMYLTRAAEIGGVSKELLQQEADRPERRAPDPARTRAANGARAPDSSRPAPRDEPRRRAPARSITPGVAAEAELVRVMLHDRSLVDFLIERLGEEDFLDRSCREIFGALVARGAEAPVEDLAQSLSPEGVHRMEAALAAPAPGELAGRIVDDALGTLECRKIRRRAADIDALLSAGRSDADALLREKLQLTRRSKELKCGGQFWK